MEAFRRTRSGFVTRMDANERTIIARVVADVAELLGFETPGPQQRTQDEGSPTDPAAQARESEEHADRMRRLAREVDAAFTAGESRGRSEGVSDDLPADPALARLLPDGSEDPEIADSLRDLTQETVRDAKGTRLQRVWGDLVGTGGLITVPAEGAMDWAGALTDVRLVLAERLGITDEGSVAAVEELAAGSPDDLTRALATLYVALSWLQESLVEAMLEELPDGA
ncbi:DUF2017 family protein [Serinibacter salmoneus]|uniref:Uncharacterized protein DUF2017 n=1 Tax=Serinibacter salmoneus TaxID=556530 RepID=A0A2A9CZY2_9MICO|nr:DUF2017 family protein [Serinibacter salmoneus]PFG19997.1 uncharacterized protein DUF2017 [Serinibacter salmoneus]